MVEKLRQKKRFQWGRETQVAWTAPPAMEREAYCSAQRVTVVVVLFS